MTYSPSVEAAISAVDEDYYTVGPDGNLITQSTATFAIAEMLDQLDVRPGMRVLEIGTGSGFSGALLSELVGPTGSVVSVDVMADLTERSRELHRTQGRTNVDLITGDGMRGVPGHGEFDRIIAWATPTMIPQAWVDQADPEAVIVTPVDITPRVRTSAILCAHLDATRRLHADALSPGGYVEMHDEVLDQWLVPPRGVDALIRDEEGTAWWISAPWAKRDQAGAEKLLNHLAESPLKPVCGLADGEDSEGFLAYLYATRPLTVAGLGTSGFRIGYADADGAALFSRNAANMVHVGSGHAVETVTGWVDSWRGEGRPGYGRLRPVLSRVDGGWQVRVHLTGG